VTKEENEDTKPPIRVKMTVGNVEFEIECQENQLKDAVEQILSTVTQHAKETVNIAETAKRSVRKNTCKGVITQLFEENWFSQPKRLDEVHSEMARKGFHYDRTAVAHALLDLVKENVLTRTGKPRRYRYTQKKPPP
jgi:stress response protein SCP2